MKTYLLIYLFVPIFFYSQNSQEYIIKEKINQLIDLEPTDKYEENKIISLSNDLYYISKKAGSKEGVITALENKANIYLTRGDVDECLKIVSEGILLAEELQNHYYMSKFFSIKAEALLDAGDYAGSRINFSKALKTTHFVKDKDLRYILRMEIYEGLIGSVEYQYDQTRKIIYKDSIVYFAKKGYEESLKISEKRFPKKKYAVGQAARLLGEVFVESSNYKQGEKYLNIAEKLLSDNNDKRLVAALYSAKGTLEFKIGNKEKALEYYQKALKLSLNFHYNDLTIEIYKNYIKYYKEVGDVKQELYFLEKSNVLSDSLSKIQKEALITQGREEISLANRKQFKNLSSYKIFMILGIIFLAASVFYYFYRKNKIKGEPKTNYLDTYPEKNKIDEDKIRTLLELAKSNDKQFLITFQEIFSDLYQELLKFDQLTSADLEMCAYLKLNMQTKEIATYKKISIGAVDNRKYRIRKKLNLLPETDLYKWINSIKP
ncbi:tetratricopeptide repeat protein [Elizabethkingia anophelis]|uniref:tetratricopeptide repeat protein n=1 Tax=Elizabethkingia anophelis TaxID=1117645 RepID=UPI0012B3B7D3|nr:tetratricopeptide repeat protein [Elizabethkingia anophelis]QGN21960.1 hypothetical protein GJV56_04630 [Elizabethkingia anophelis]QNV08616.1 tetratricopeptide repeat protein [Elizabethkingia anophelis]UTF90364.1 tetratricopeptide repeat protein [Elizabethkingia anophelis]UTG01235.1 tetratricopeptide repeat protein [Elizabethkingia anophelis]UTG04985.1 tetratricopeptide repeat protein [Elizabethkingia anophelis]